MTDREQLIDVMMRALCEHHHGQGSATCDEEQEGDSYVREEMYAILAEIEAAGYVLMERGRAERLLDLCRAVDELLLRYSASPVTCDEVDWPGSQLIGVWMALEPGDLGPLEDGE